MDKDILRIADFGSGAVNGGDLQMRTQTQCRLSGIEQLHHHRIGDRFLDLCADQQHGESA